MFFNMVLEISGLVRPYGFLSRRSAVGGSVARARDAKVSIIRFTQSMGTALKGDAPFAQDPIKHSMTATTFTVSWNCKNLEIES